MKIITGHPNITMDFDGNMTVSFPVYKESSSAVKAFNDGLNDMKDKLSVEVKEYRRKRSLNANNYMWELCTQIANALRTDKDIVYLQMLKRYGQSQMISIIKDGAEQFKRAVKYYEEAGESILNGKEFVHIKCYIGSSEYDTKEMSILVDGIVSECKELGIETLTPNELSLLKERWGNEKHNSK